MTGERRTAPLREIEEAKNPSRRFPFVVASIAALGALAACIAVAESESPQDRAARERFLANATAPFRPIELPPVSHRRITPEWAACKDQENSGDEMACEGVQEYE